jgi:hypothetical protein
LFLFEQLGIGSTAETVAQFVHVPEVHQPLPECGDKATQAESVERLADWYVKRET